MPQELAEGSIVVISSKVVALCENRVVPVDAATRDELILQEAEHFVDPSFSQYGHHFTINGGTLVGSAGIDLSNADNQWVLWPSDVFASAEMIRIFLKKKYGVRQVGVIISDSVSSPLRRGTKGEMLAWSGFRATRNYVGEHDLFGRDFKLEVAGIGTGLAAAANLVMGEGAEQTPIAIVSDVDFVNFVDERPSQSEIDGAIVPFEEDLFMPFMKLMPWQAGKNGHKS
jgi:F420-0:gamma-glutamyl ligase